MILTFEHELSKLGTGNYNIFKPLVMHFYELIKDLPASVNNWHPPGEEQPGGMVLHCKRVAHLCLGAVEEFRLSYDVKDALLLASMLHDVGRVIKYQADGESEPDYHKRNHGSKSVEFIGVAMIKIGMPVGRLRDISMPALSVYRMMCSCIQRHMSHWDEPDKTPDSLPEYLFAFCDYLASRKWLGGVVPIGLD